MITIFVFWGVITVFVLVFVFTPMFKKSSDASVAFGVFFFIYTTLFIAFSVNILRFALHYII